MSNHLAIATVTKALVQMLETAVGNAVGGAHVVTKRPDVSTADKTVDVFLYQVTPNAALRNSDLPARDSRGDVVNRPKSALDLHYLFSFYGDGESYAAQRMLGAAVTALLAEPGLSRERIISVSKDDNNDNMGSSNLADAIEQVKFTQQALTLEELSRIWSIFYQVPYVLSVAYKATVVILESEEFALAQKPVLKRGSDDRGVDTRVGPFPQLDSWHIGEGDDDNVRLRMKSYPSARLGTILTLRGRNLGSDRVIVRMTSERFPDEKLEIPASVIAGRPGEVRISIPNATADASKWIAGFYSVSIAVTSGDTARLTNAAALPFAPQISGVTVGARDADNNVTVTIDAAPKVHANQIAFLTLPDRDVPANARSQDADPLTFKVISPKKNAKPIAIRLRVGGIDNMPFKGQGNPPRPVPDETFIDFPA